MGEPDPEDRASLARGTGRALVALTLFACLGPLGCSSSSGGDPEALPPQTSTRHRAETPTPTPPPPPPPTVTPAPTTIVIEPPRAESEGEVGLVEAARREKERRAGAAPPAVKLDNKNLGSFAADQKLTVASPENVTADAEAPAAGESKAPPTGKGADEAYWREGVRAIRERWADAVTDVDRLESESADLRRQFYAEDDPYVRDEQVKPEWDRVLGELDRARREAAQAPRDLEVFLDEGRRAGALPGWLREGIELEPEEAPDDATALNPAEPREPVVVDRDPENP